MLYDAGLQYPPLYTRWAPHFAHSVAVVINPSVVLLSHFWHAPVFVLKPSHCIDNLSDKTQVKLLYILRFEHLSHSDFVGGVFWASFVRGYHWRLFTMFAQTIFGRSILLSK